MQHTHILWSSILIACVKYQMRTVNRHLGITHRNRAQCTYLLYQMHLCASANSNDHAYVFLFTGEIKHVVVSLQAALYRLLFQCSFSLFLVYRLFFYGNLLHSHHFISYTKACNSSLTLFRSNNKNI